MTPEPSPFYPDLSDAAQCVGAARHDIANAELIAHMAECPECDESLFGFCDVALEIVASSPELHPTLN